MTKKYEFIDKSNFNDINTYHEDQINKKEKRNVIQAFFDENEDCLKPIIKIDQYVEEIKLGIEYIFFFCKIIYQYSLEVNAKYKIIIRNRNNNSCDLPEIELNSKYYYIAEIKENDENYVIICQDNKIYKLGKDFNKLEFIDMEINLILKIKNYEYVISNNNGTFKYEGSILKITKENLEIEKKKISDKKYNLGVLINERTIVLCNNKDNIPFNKNEYQLMVYNINEMKIKFELPRGFSENCYALLSVKNYMIFEENEIENNMLLYYCKNDKKWVVIENDYAKLLENDDFNFEVICFLPIKINVEETINAFSEKYDEKYNYLLVGGYSRYDNNFKENKIKLYIFTEYYNNIKKSKDIRIEKNNIWSDLPTIKNIIQINYKNIMINFIGGKAVIFEIMNLETQEQQVNENEFFQNNFNNNLAQNISDLQVIDRPFLNGITIENIYPLENNYFIIVQENKISVVNGKDFSSYYDFKFKGLINCFCQINENEVIICGNNGLYNLVFSNYKKEEKKINNLVSLNKINDIEYQLILKVPNKINEYIVSLPQKGTFKVNRSISSINKSDFKTKISDRTYNRGKIIKIKNQIFCMLMNNIENKGVCEIIDIENKENNYKSNANDYLYNLSINCLVSLLTNEILNNCIILNASKNKNKNRLSAFNIGTPLHTTFEYSKQTDIEIICMSPYKNEINTKEKSFNYCFIGGYKDLNNFEIDLYKIIFQNEHKNCLCIELIGKVIFDNEVINQINSMYPSFNGKGFILASNNKLYINDKPIKENENLQ